MAFLHGTSGDFAWDSGYSANCLSWTLTWDALIHDTTILGAANGTWATFTPGTIDWNATAEFLFDDVINIVEGTASDPGPGDTGALTLTLETGHTFIANAILREVRPRVSGTDLNRLTMVFDCNGVPAWTGAS